jgi:ABC-type branched-subunit amino acid transport system substrate-binding protein
LRNRILPLLGLVLLVAACGGPPPAETQARLEAATFRIGLAQLTRRDVEIGRAAALAVEEINASGGVEGAVRLELVTPDEAGEPGDVVRRLAQRGVQALVLTCERDAVREQADVAQRTQVLAFTPCNEEPALPSRFPVVWPVSLPANAEAAALADFALTRGYKTANVVGDGPIARYLRAALATRNIGSGGDVTIFTGSPSGLPAARPLLGTHLLDTEAFLQLAGAEGVAFTTYGFPTPNSAAGEFYAAFEKQYGRAPSGSWVALGYDAVTVLAKAMGDAASVDPDAIAERIGRGLEIDGGLGEITYPGSGEHIPETAAAVVQVRGGKRVLVEKSLPEDVPPP